MIKKSVGIVLILYALWQEYQVFWLTSRKII